MTTLASVALAPAADKAGWTLAAALRAAARHRPDQIAVRTTRGETLTYADMLARVESLAAGLLALGVRPGDRIVLMMDNSIEMLLTWFAVNVAGAVEVPSNTAHRGRSLAHVLAQCGAAVAVIDSRYADVLSEIRSDVPDLRTVVVNGPPTDLPWPCHDLRSVPRDGDRDRVAAPTATYRDPAAIIYTSGTTGPAKGVVVPHGHMYTFARHVAEQLRLTSDDVYYVCLPLFHANAQFMQVYASVLAAGTVVLAERFSAGNWVREVHECGATVSSLLGVMAQFLFNQPPSGLDTRHSLRRMITIPLPAAIAEEFERRFAVTCVEAYGMTEVCLPLYRRLDEPLRPGSCGRPLDDWFEVAIVDPETDEPLPDGEIGEIVVRPCRPFTTFSGYHAMPERTVDAWRNLWFHTGDAGRRDSDGYYYFVDRLKDRIRRRGENISAYDVEVALTELPDVLDVAVVATPASEGEDDIKAFLVVAEPAAFDPVAILRHCAERLPYFAVPRYLELVPELPRTANGKVLKRELRARADSGGQWDRERAGWTVRRGTAGVVRTRP
ncbi:AMP-binding protein [Pseudonocardia sp.]|uniref:AMP-binding protein n=1 Tax=Pseudonocardia sp. TaxID=60912 RepID=UPI003D096216